MSLQTQFMTFFISPFSEPSSSAELNNFLKSHRIINVEKRLIDGERGTGWVFLVEYTENEGGKSAYTMSSKVDWRDVLNPSQFAVYDLRFEHFQQRPSGVRLFASVLRTAPLQERKRSHQN